MANISVRNLDDSIHEQLRIRAAQQGISVEEAVRRIIKRSVTAPHRLGELAVQCFGPAHGIELEPLERPHHEPVSFDE